MTVGVAILSRYNSSRLPGKALKEINGKTLLKYIYERVNKVLPSDQIIIATSEEKSDDVISNYCEKQNWKCYRGSLDNVAERFYQSGIDLGVDYLIRINGDNLFLDIPLLESMIKLTQSYQYDFISNVKGRTFPKGMSIEVVRLDHYKNLLNEITNEEQYKEHVTLYLYENELNSYHFVYNDELKEMEGIQLAIDTQEDFEKAIAIINSFEKDHTKYNIKDIAEIISTKEL
ncbi:cytidylyltransferase domain-containing protein [Marivirga sp.]|uniref:cytidylyltransferase domain-containing protein n=1 Tax=Marivirga sp. TaxID=2018662 RepID=UPI003DA737A9